MPRSPRSNWHEILRRLQHAADLSRLSSAHADERANSRARACSPPGELEQRVALQALIDRLPLTPKLALTLHLKGESLAEIAQRLSLSPPEVWAAWREGALKIQELLDRA